MILQEYREMGLPESVALKMDRANHHFDCIISECRRYTLENAHELVTKAKNNGEKHVTRLYVLANPDERMPTWVGDFLHNVHGAIDNLAWALAQREAAPPSRTQFPIFRSKREWIGNAGPHVEGMSVRAQTVIRSLQPYRAGEFADDHPLWLLKQLSNWDKHRSLNVVGAGVGTVAGGGGWEGDSNRPEIVIAPGVVVHGAVLATITPPVPTPQVQVNLYPRLFVIFAEGTPVPLVWVETTLNRILKHVNGNVFPVLAPLLA
jgi:hypothetical protein